MPLTIGVDMTEISKRTKAMKSSKVSGVAGRNISVQRQGCLNRREVVLVAR